MRKRILGLIFLMGLAIFVLSGCRCEPSTQTWCVQSFQKPTVYIGGVERVDTYSGVPSVAEPFGGMHDGFVDICFSDDGTVTFQPGTGESLTGNYTYKHNGWRNTDFTVTLDNGETFSGTANTYYYGSSLEFTFRELEYYFENTGGMAEEDYTQYLQNVSQSIRQWVKNGRTDAPLKHGTVTAGEVGYVLELQESTIALDETVAVQCVRLDAENNLIALDAIEEGECYCVITVPSNDFARITVYYIDPLPEDVLLTEPKPETAMLPELEPWLAELNAGDVTQIKLTKQYTSTPIGFKKHHQYITDPTQIKNILAMMQEMEMTRASGEEWTDAQAQVLTLRIYTQTGEFVICAEGGFLILDAYSYWIFDDFPEFSYENAVQSFMVSENDTADLYDGDTHLGTYTDLVGQIEFIVDPEEHHYTTTTPRLTLVCEFGEITIYDSTHFWYKGQSYLITSELELPFG